MGRCVVTLEFRSLSLSHIGVIGSGQIGPDIALHFARELWPHRVRVTVLDVSEKALSQGRAKLERKLEKDVSGQRLSAEAAAAIRDLTRFSADYADLGGAGLVVEAATENLELKRRIFSDLRGRLGPAAALISNSSHLTPEEMFCALPHPERGLVVHYFFPAERNPMVEVVAGAETDPALVQDMLLFYQWIGKLPIRVGSRYGYAVDPIFEGQFLAAALCVEKGLGTVKEVDAVSREALGATVGSFTAMNLAGGNPLIDHGLAECGRRFHGWFRSPALLKRQLELAKPWEVAARGETVDVEPARRQSIVRRLRGANFGLVGQIMDAGIVEVADHDLLLRAALDIKPPYSFMNELGIGESLRLVEEYAAAYPAFPVPQCLKRQAAAGRPFELPTVRRSDRGAVAVLEIRNPLHKNSLDDKTCGELARFLGELRAEDAVRAVVLTGFGRDFYASGPEGAALEALLVSARRLGKPLVHAINGKAEGAGRRLLLTGVGGIAAAQRPGAPALVPSVETAPFSDLVERACARALELARQF